MTDFYAELEGQLSDAARRHHDRGPARRALAGRGRVVVVAGAVAVALGFGTALLAGGEEASAPPARESPAPEAPVTPALEGVRVAVLNGTTRSGLAGEVAATLARRGATIVEVGNAPDQQRRSTALTHRPRKNQDLLRVLKVMAQDLRIRAAGRPTRPNVDVATPEADVVVIAGADLIR